MKFDVEWIKNQIVYHKATIDKNVGAIELLNSMLKNGFGQESLEEIKNDKAIPEK